MKLCNREEKVSNIRLFEVIHLNDEIYIKDINFTDDYIIMSVIIQ